MGKLEEQKNKKFLSKKNKINSDFNTEIISLLSISDNKTILADNTINDYISSTNSNNYTKSLQCFLSSFKILPDTIRLSDDVYNMFDLRNFLKSKNYKIMSQEFFYYDDETSIDYILLINEENKSLFYLQRTHSDSEFGNLGNLSVHFDSKNKDEIQKIILEIFSLYKINKKKKNEIYLIVLENKQLRLKQFEIKDLDIDLDLHYGESFFDIHNKLVNDLNDPFGKGIALLYSEPGCGKTSYIRYLIKLIQSKKVIYIPPNLAEEISSPTFLSFLMDHTNSILIIEDAENIIRSRETEGYSSQAVQNLLNLSDGILGDILKIQIVATFNTDRSNIDKALLRDGRLIVEHKFGKLSIENSKKLSKYLEIDSDIDKEMTLSEIYNQKNKSIRHGKEKSTIGFRTGNS